MLIRKSFHAGTNPIRTWRGKQQFNNGVQIIARGKDDGNAYSQSRIHTPIHQGQNEEEEVFVAQKSEELHRQLEPTTKRLNANDPVDSVLGEDVHVGLL